VPQQNNLRRIEEHAKPTQEPCPPRARLAEKRLLSTETS